MQVRPIALLLSASTFLSACEGGEAPPPVTTSAASASTAPTPSASGAATASPPPRAAPATSASQGTAFVRHPPHSQNSDADAVDECTQSGGNYFSCRGAYLDEADPVLKRYLWRIAQGHAAGVAGYGPREPSSESPPHAEVPAACDPKKPCGATKGTMIVNDAMTCLALAAAADDAATAKAAHAHACRCDRKGGAFVAYNWTSYICDEKGRPAFIAPSMKKDEGADIIDCAECHPERGPAACQREIARLQTADPPLATHVETKQLRRCKTPNEGPYTWEQR